MSLTTIHASSGEAMTPDPNCLHCHLAAVINTWREQHPGQSAILETQKVLEVAAEMIASGCEDKQLHERALAQMGGYMREISRNAWKLFKPLRRRQ